MAQLGTEWVADREGSTWRELFKAFEPSSPVRDYQFGTSSKPTISAALSDRTNLLLTGSPIADYDRQRWKSGNVR